MATPATKICISPLSPTYSTLPRLNTTALLLFILLSPSATWATKGALAALMIRISTISLNAFVLQATKSPTSPFDLDILGCWFLLSQTSAAVPLMLCWSPSLRHSEARSLVRVWGILVVVGAVCAFATLRWISWNLDERSCSSPGIATLSLSRDEIYSLHESNLHRKFDLLALIVAGLGGWTCMRPKHLFRKTHAESILWCFEKVLISGFAVIVLVSGTVLHEMFMLGKEKPMPMLEPITAFEQWSCWAATGFVIGATMFNWLLVGKNGLDPSPKELDHSIDHPLKSMESDLEWAGILGRPAPAHIS